jgi:hypothetical protein
MPEFRSEPYLYLPAVTHKSALVALAARGGTPPAFGRPCISPGGVTPPSNIPDILGRRALPVGRIAALGATAEFHHGLLGAFHYRVTGSAIDVRL